MANEDTKPGMLDAEKIEQLALAVDWLLSGMDRAAKHLPPATQDYVQFCTIAAEKALKHVKGSH